MRDRHHQRAGGGDGGDARVAGPVRVDILGALKLAATAAPSQGVPLWNMRSGRRVMVHTV